MFGIERTVSTPKESIEYEEPEDWNRNWMLVPISSRVE